MKISDIKGNIPDPRAFHSSNMIKNTFICIYGGILQNGQISNEFFIYDMVKKEFSLILNNSSNLFTKLFN